MTLTETGNEIAVSPVPPGSAPAAYCLAFYDWGQKLNDQWLDRIEAVFATCGLTPWEGTGNTDDGGRTHGKYSRVRKKLRSFLSKEGPDIRVQSPTTNEDSFFPCELTFVLHTKASGMPEGMIAIRSSSAQSLRAFVEQMESAVFGSTGPAYATGFEFPAKYGPDAYLSSISAMPKGVAGVSQVYEERITQWRDNTDDGFRPRDGFLREVYEINFLTDTHLVQQLGAETLEGFIRRHGVVTPGPTNGVTRWDVPSKSLDQVRRELEPTGLVLSSTTTSPRALQQRA